GLYGTAATVHVSGCPAPFTRSGPSACPVAGNVAMNTTAASRVLVVRSAMLRRERERDTVGSGGRPNLRRRLRIAMTDCGMAEFRRGGARDGAVLPRRLAGCHAIFRRTRAKREFT